MNIVESSYQFFHKNNHFVRPLLPSGSGYVAPSLSPKPAEESRTTPASCARSR